MPDSSRLAGSSELELLLTCARFTVGSADAAALADGAHTGVDWDRLSRLASHHRMLPLVCRALSIADREGLSAEISEHIADSYRSNTGRTRFLTATLLALVDRFESKGIRTAPFKGPTLAVSVYGDVGLRQFNDLDILVHEEDVRAASEVLASDGWRPEFQLSPQEQRMFLRYGWARHFFRDDGDIILDMHWRVTHPSFVQIDSDPLWQRLESVQLNGQELQTLGMEDTVLLLAIHGCKHRWQSLEWLCTLAKLSSRMSDAGWRRVLQSASETGSRRMLLIACSLASRLLEARLPELVLTEVKKDAEAERLANVIIGRLYRNETVQPGTFDSLQLFDLQMRERWSDRVNYAFHQGLAPSPEEWRSIRLPMPLYPLYYVIRPLRLAVKYGRKSLLALKS